MDKNIYIDKNKNDEYLFEDDLFEKQINEKDIIIFTYRNNNNGDNISFLFILWTIS